MNNLLVLFLLLAIIVVIIRSNYVNNLKMLKLCENPVPPYVENRTIILKLEMFKKKDKRLIKGNVTVNVSEPTKDYLWKVLGFIQKNGKLKKFVESKGLTCKYPLIYAYLLAAKVTFDRESCTLKKGFYNFENIDVDVLDHTFSVIPLRTPGNCKWIISMYNTKGNIFCFEVYSEIVYLRTKN